jgi:RNA polymerase sigma factor (sigma-70 family)
MSATVTPTASARGPRRRRGQITSALAKRRALDITEQYKSERAVVCRDAAAQARRMVSGSVPITTEAVDEAYNTAWLQLYTQLQQGKPINDPRAWLVTTTSRRLVDALRKEHLDRRDDTDPDDAVEASPLRSLPGYDETLAAEDAAREMLKALAQRLTEREMQLVRMLILDDFTQAEAGELLGIKEKRVNKLVTERVLPALRTIGADALIAQGDVRVGDWCDSPEGRSALTAMVAGVLDPDGERYALVASHLRNCPRCRATLGVKHAAAGVIPPLVVPVGNDHARETLERLLDAARDSGAAEAVAGAAVVGGIAATAGSGGVAAGGSLAAAITAKVAAGAAALAVAGGAGVAADRATSPPPERVQAAAQQAQVALPPVAASVVAKAQAQQAAARKRAGQRAAAKRKAAGRKAAARRKAAEKADNAAQGTASQDFQPTVASQQQDAAREQELSIERPAATPSDGGPSRAQPSSGSSEFGVE